MHLRNRTHLLAAFCILLPWKLVDRPGFRCSRAAAVRAAGSAAIRAAGAQHTPQQAPHAAARKRRPRRPRPISQATRFRWLRRGSRRPRRTDDVFVFKKEVDEVTLHATVVDDHFRPITGLTKTDFNVLRGRPAAEDHLVPQRRHSGGARHRHRQLRFHAR